MDEREFLRKLEDRAKEQESLMKDMVLSGTFHSVVLWLGEHPWRILIPIASIITFLLRLVFGHDYYEFTLWIFGGL